MINHAQITLEWVRTAQEDRWAKFLFYPNYSVGWEVGVTTRAAAILSIATANVQVFIGTTQHPCDIFTSLPLIFFKYYWRLIKTGSHVSL